MENTESRKKSKTGANISEDKYNQLVNCFETVLDVFGIDLEDENFSKTPKRMANSYIEILQGLLETTEEKINDYLNVTFPCSYDEMIVIKDVECWSICPHHFLPVKYNISIGYIPDGKVLGASKLPRVIKLLAKKPVLQEQLTDDIVNCVIRSTKPKGVILQVKGQHTCMMMRGIKSNSSMITSSIKGVFETTPSAKDEFFKLIK